MFKKTFFPLVLSIVLPLFTQGQLSEVAASEINIPLQLSLKPFYEWIERSVDTVFLSEGYPEGWVQKGCDLRYKYKFWRGPLRLKASGQTLDLAFSGNYQVEGSTRVCLRKVVISPWSPSCRCGYSEGPRKVEMRFFNTLTVLPTYQLQLKIQPEAPQPINSCKVCLWEQDITRDVMNGIWEEQLATKKDLEQQYGVIDLKPHLIETWNKMSRPVAMGAYGWLMIRPLGFSLNKINARGDSVDISVGLRARPVVVSSVPKAYMTALPATWDNPTASDSFTIRMAVDLRYDSLSQVLNRSFLPMSVKPSKGPFRRKVHIDSLALMGVGDDRISCKLNISGKYAGILMLAGKPVWDSASGLLRLTEIEFDLKTRHGILGKAAKWFDRPIRKWLEANFQFDLASEMNTQKKWIEEKLNEAETGPVNCAGKLNRVEWLGWENRTDILSVQIGLHGQMRCTADISRFTL
ncbi:MAG: DUF4403 family protein [Bacteroidetes bacterium]|nr:DUF4403 family protein [Bacteroidota bacterium]